MHSLPLRTKVEADDHVAEDYHNFQRQKKLSQSIGSAIAPHYQPHTLLSNPPSPADITLELLLASQSHLGHSTSLWNPANARYIFGVRQGVHIISLDVTASHLRRACSVVRSVTERGGLVLFVGTRDGHDRAVVKAAEMAGGCHLFDRWIPGSITNGPQILGRCGVKVVDEKDREVGGFEEQLEAHGALKPDLVVCLNPLENYVLLHECGLNNIPTIGVIDTDANPTWVTYPIPANDDSLRCIQVIAGVLGRAGQEGQVSRLRQAAAGSATYQATHNLVAPTSEGLSRDADLTFNPNLDPATNTNRDLTSTTSLQNDPNYDANLDVSLMAAYEYARFADFDEEAVQAALDMFEVQTGFGNETPEMDELREKLRNAKQAHGIDEDGTSAIESQYLSREDALRMEDDVQEMMDEPMTTEEAAALHARAGGKGKNIYEGSSFRTVLKRRADDADPTLARMIALKRREYGEELSVADQEELKNFDVEQKQASPVDEGELRLR